MSDEGVRRAAARVARSLAAQAAGLPDGRYQLTSAGLTIKDRSLGGGLEQVGGGVSEQGGDVGEPSGRLPAGSGGTAVVWPDHRLGAAPGPSEPRDSALLRDGDRPQPEPGAGLGSPAPWWRARIEGARQQVASMRRVYSPVAASSRDARWLIPVGVITMAGVIAGVASEGLPPGAAGDMMVGLLVVAAACWGVALSQRIDDQRVVVLALAGLGICGAGLDWQQNDGPGFVVGYLALTGLALRVPRRRMALLAGAPIVAGIAAADAHDSANPVSTILAAVLSAGFLFVTSAVAAFSRDAHHRAEAQLAREAAVREAREQMATVAERSRLARELHDVLAHSLSGLFVQLEAGRLLAASTSADVRLAGHIAQAQRLAQSGMLNARRALEALRGDEIPGPENLPDLISETTSAWGIPIAFRVEGVPHPLTPEAGLTVYRAVQEALTNAGNHAGRGVRVSVLLTWASDSIEVSVSDSGGDGAGAGLTSSGFGLTSMAERAAAQGGRLDAGPVDGGFRVQLRLPLIPVPQPRRS